MMKAEDRVRLCREFLSDKVDQRTICRRLRMSPGTLSRIQNAGDEPFEFQKRGRKPCITNEMSQFIDLNLSADAMIKDADMTQMVNEKFGTSVSVSSVRRARIALKFEFRPPKICQELTEDQIALRLEFCRWVLGNQEQLNNLIFSDESRFERCPDNGWRRIRRGTWNDNCFCRQTKFPQGVMVWGAVGVGFRTPLIQCSKGVGADEYIDIIERSNMIRECNAKFGQGNWVFVQDGAPSHTSKKALDYLDSQKVKVMPGWPPNSPDLNPIEMLWAILKKKVAGQIIKSDRCFDLLRESWELIADQTINSLVKSFIRRCQLVLDLGGMSATPYLSSGRQETPPIALPAPLWTDEEDAQLRRLRSEGTTMSMLQSIFAKKKRRLIHQRCKMHDQILRNLSYEPPPPLTSVTNFVGPDTPADLDVFLQKVGRFQCREFLLQNGVTL